MSRGCTHGIGSTSTARSYGTYSRKTEQLWGDRKMDTVTATEVKTAADRIIELNDILAGPARQLHHGGTRTSGQYSLPKSPCSPATTRRRGYRDLPAIGLREVPKIAGDAPQA
ncbi:hypothetical protein [Amycolatopsis benzoatilytica]|uniref:hypothetical protein n=1 Tax=Amycolatopsis benzoatilytica TaxID=346045 RepID=UPI00146A16DB|nr:hypothetical protein [Amycolatopsis benzoatilytica]